MDKITSNLDRLDDVITQRDALLKACRLHHDYGMDSALLCIVSEKLLGLADALTGGASVPVARRNAGRPTALPQAGPRSDQPGTRVHRADLVRALRAQDA